MAPTVLSYEEKLAAANRGFKALFLKSLQTASPAEKVRLFCMETTSSGPEESYNWLGAVPMMAEHKGDRKYARLRADGHIIKNKPWANGILINLDDIADDRLGLYEPQIQMLAYAAAQHSWRLVRQLLLQAFSTSAPAYDGMAFCSNTHRDGDKVQDNLTTGALSAAKWKEAREMMRAFVDEEDEPLDMVPTHLVVGETNESTALEILTAELLGVTGEGTKTNIWKGSAEPIIIPGLGNAWFAFDLSKPLKPAIFQMREGVITQSNMLSAAAGSDSFIDRNEAKFGARYRGNVGWGFWQCCVGSAG